MSSQRPRRPMPPSSLPPAEQPRNTASVGIPTQEYADKVNLARHLHDQGINPLLWTQAQPAPAAEQEQFRKTGQKPRDGQFEVAGRLYDGTPAMAAAPAQGKAALDTYLKEIGAHDVKDPPPIERYVDIDKVPLQHPLGQPFVFSATPESNAVLRNMIQTRINPQNAHLGDPLPLPIQEKLKQSVERQPMIGRSPASPEQPDLRDEPEPSDLLYRNADGWIYAKNDATREPDDVLRIRAKHAEKRAEQTASPALTAANENTAEEVEEIIRYYIGKDREGHAATDKPDDNGNDSVSEVQEGGNALEASAKNLLSVVEMTEKAASGEALSTSEELLKARIAEAFREIGIAYQPSMTNMDYLKSQAKVFSRRVQMMTHEDAEIPPEVLAAFNLSIAEALVGGRLPAVIGAQQGLAASVPFALRHSLPGKAITATLQSLGLIASAERDNPDLLLGDSEAGGALVLSMPPQASISTPNQQQKVNTDILLPNVTGHKIHDLSPPSPETLKALESRLADAKEFEIWVGGERLYKQGEHKTFIDNVFREEFIAIAEAKGCLPDPRNRSEKNFGEYGGDKAQKRIGDPDRPGNWGSRQTDSTIRWRNEDKNWTEVHFNSTTTKSDGVTEIVREWKALLGILQNVQKHLASIANGKSTLSYKTPVLGDGPVYHMGEKKSWTADEIKEFVRKKLKERFDKDFQDCKFIGESRLVKLDDPRDPDINSGSGD